MGPFDYMTQLEDDPFWVMNDKRSKPALKVDCARPEWPGYSEDEVWEIFSPLRFDSGMSTHEKLILINERDGKLNTHIEPIYELQNDHALQYLVASNEALLKKDLDMTATYLKKCYELTQFQEYNDSYEGLRVYVTHTGNKLEDLENVQAFFSRQKTWSRRYLTTCRELAGCKHKIEKWKSWFSQHCGAETFSPGTWEHSRIDLYNTKTEVPPPKLVYQKPNWLREFPKMCGTYIVIKDKQDTREIKCVFKNRAITVRPLGR